MLKDYQVTLKDLHKANVLKSNDAFTLRKRRNGKRLLEDYQKALEGPTMLFKTTRAPLNHCFLKRIFF
jgi:hypothetical protein